MARLLVHVEGQTEEGFVNEILPAHLVERGYSSVGARIFGNARMRRNRGGVTPWSAASSDIVRHLKEDPTCIFTTMVDYYGLPKSGDGAWPGCDKAARQMGEKKALEIEAAMLDSVAARFGSSFNPRRFIPFVLWHEFEGLLFSDCTAFSRAIARPDLQRAFAEVRQQFATPEDINDSTETHPSKLVKHLMPQYQKPLHGLLAAREIGLDCIRRECPHFDGWLTELESRADLSPIAR